MSDLSPYAVNVHHFDREYILEPVLENGEVPYTTHIYEDSLKDAYLVAIDILDHCCAGNDEARDIETLRIHHRGLVVATLTAFDRTSHYVDTPTGWVARYEPGSVERQAKARYQSKYVIEKNADL